MLEKKLNEMCYILNCVICMMNQLFNNERFSGMDRVGDQNFYTLSMEYKKRHMSMDKLAINISKKYYVDDRNVWLDDMDMGSMSRGMMGMDSMTLHKVIILGMISFVKLTVKKEEEQTQFHCLVIRLTTGSLMTKGTYTLNLKESRLEWRFAHRHLLSRQTMR